MKERNKEKENRKLIVVSIRPGAPPAGWPVHPIQTAIGGLTHPGQSTPRKPDTTPAGGCTRAEA